MPSLEVETRRELVRIGKEAILEEVSTSVRSSSVLLFRVLSFITSFNA